MDQDNFDESFYAEPEVPGDITYTPEELTQLEALATEVEQPIEEAVEIPPTPAEMNITDPMDLIPIAIANNQLLQIQYMNRNGETKFYIIEPYEIGGNGSHPAGYLWGFDQNAGTIKSFFLSNLIDIQLLNETFIPRS